MELGSLPPNEQDTGFEVGVGAGPGGSQRPSGPEIDNSSVNCKTCISHSYSQNSIKLKQRGAGNQILRGQRGKISLICLDGKSMTPCQGNTILFCSSESYS